MENKDGLLNVYGAKPSKSGNGYNVTLVLGRDDGRKFFNVFVKNENVKVEGGSIFVKVKLLAEKKEEAKPEKTEDEDLPF